MTPTDTEKLIIRWTTRDAKAIEAIRKRFGIPVYTTINGFSPVLLNEVDREIFEETSRRGYFAIIHEKWCKNGASITF